MFIATVPLSSDDTFEIDFLLESQAGAAAFFNRSRKFLTGAANAFASNQLLGAGRVDDDDDDYAAGSAHRRHCLCY